MRRNIFLPNVRHPFILNYSPTENVQPDGTGPTRKTYTYLYGRDHTLQNFPYIRELSFTKSLFKNIYYQSTQYDLFVAASLKLYRPSLHFAHKTMPANASSVP